MRASRMPHTEIKHEIKSDKDFLMCRCRLRSFVRALIFFSFSSFSFCADLRLNNNNFSLKLRASDIVFFFVCARWSMADVWCIISVGAFDNNDLAIVHCFECKKESIFIEANCCWCDCEAKIAHRADACDYFIYLTFCFPFVCAIVVVITNSNEESC